MVYLDGENPLLYLEFTVYSKELFRTGFEKVVNWGNIPFSDDFNQRINERRGISVIEYLKAYCWQDVDRENDDCMSTWSAQTHTSRGCNVRAFNIPSIPKLHAVNIITSLNLRLAFHRTGRDFLATNRDRIDPDLRREFHLLTKSEITLTPYITCLSLHYLEYRDCSKAIMEDDDYFTSYLFFPMPLDARRSGLQDPKNMKELSQILSFASASQIKSKYHGRYYEVLSIFWMRVSILLAEEFPSYSSEIENTKRNLSFENYISYLIWIQFLRNDHDGAHIRMRLFFTVIQIYFHRFLIIIASHESESLSKQDGQRVSTLCSQLESWIINTGCSSCVIKHVNNMLKNDQPRSIPFFFERTTMLFDTFMRQEGIGFTLNESENGASDACKSLSNRPWGATDSAHIDHVIGVVHSFHIFFAQFKRYFTYGNSFYLNSLFVDCKSLNAFEHTKLNIEERIATIGINILPANTILPESYSFTIAVLYTVLEIIYKSCCALDFAVRNKSSIEVRLCPLVCMLRSHFPYQDIFTLLETYDNFLGLHAYANTIGDLSPLFARRVIELLKIFERCFNSETVLNNGRLLEYFRENSLYLAKTKNNNTVLMLKFSHFLEQLCR